MTTIRQKDLLAHLALPALLLFLGAWGAWAILLDNQPSFSDSVFPYSFTLYNWFRGNEGTYLQFVSTTGYRPPLAYLPASLLYLIFGPSLALLRLTILAQFLVAVWCVHSICLAVTRSRAAGLLGATLAGSLPMTFGWGRMSYVETGMSLMVLLSVWLLVTRRLERPREGVALGLAAGLGMLTKVAFPIFAIGPLAWALLYRLRSRRQALTLVLAVSVCLVVLVGWYEPQLQRVLDNIGMSSNVKPGGPILQDLLYKLGTYTLELDRVTPLLLLALGGSLLAWRTGAVAASHLALLNLATWPALCFILFFHQSRRYPLPVYWMASALAAICLVGLLKRHRPGALGPLVAVCCALLLGDFVALNMGWRKIHTPPGSALEMAGPRVDGVGLMRPDRRPYSEYPAAVNRAAEEGLGDCLEVTSGMRGDEMLMSRRQHWAITGDRSTEFPITWQELLDLAERPDIQAGNGLCVISVTDVTEKRGWGTAPIPEQEWVMACQTYRRVARLTNKRSLGRWGPSPLGLVYELFRLDPAELVRAPREPPGGCVLATEL